MTALLLLAGLAVAVALLYGVGYLLVSVWLWITWRRETARCRKRGPSR